MPHTSWPRTQWRAAPTNWRGATSVARRTRLRSRVLLLTAAFAIALFAITFGLSWRAQVAQERWSRLVGVETRAIATLEGLIRAQNAHRANAVACSTAHYRVVCQLIDSLSTIDPS